MVISSRAPGSDQTDSTALWHSLVAAIFKTASDNYDVPTNLQEKHLKIFLPLPEKKRSSRSTTPTYLELVSFN